MITKKVLAFAAALTAFCCLGCSAATEETASADASESVPASASADAALTGPDLDAEHSIEGLSYKVSSEWEETDAGTMAAYSGEIDADLPFTITVAALDSELVLAAEASDAEPNGALLSMLGVNSSGLNQAKLDGQSAISFSGEAENAYQATGYTVREDDGTMFVVMIQSTNVSDVDVQQVWQDFLATVKLPG